MLITNIKKLIFISELMCFGIIATNVLGIAEGEEIEAESFDFAPRRAKTNFYELNLQNKNE